MRIPYIGAPLFHSRIWGIYGADARRCVVACRHRILGVHVFAMLAVALAFLPSVAYAEEGLGSSFTNGFNTLLGNPEVSTNDGNDFQREYEPEPVTLNAAPAEQPGTTQGNIEWVTDAVNYVPWGNSKLRIINWLRAFLGETSSAMRLIMITVPVGLCFMWWGVRKAIRMLMGTARGRKLNV